MPLLEAQKNPPHRGSWEYPRTQVIKRKKSEERHEPKAKAAARRGVGGREQDREDLELGAHHGVHLPDDAGRSPVLCSVVLCRSVQTLRFQSSSFETVCRILGFPLSLLFNSNLLIFAGGKKIENVGKG